MAFDITHLLENEAATETAILFTSKNGTVDSGISPRNTQLQWCLETNGATVSGNTGPTANPPGRSAYIYTEASETGTPASDNWAARIRDPIDNTSQNVFTEFLYNDGFETGSTLTVEYATVASPNETTDWTVLASIPGALPSVAWQQSVVYDFSSVPSTTTLHIRLHVDATAAFTNDVALSTWRIFGIDTATPGAGLTMASARFQAGAAGLVNPSAFTFGRSLPSSTIVLALRKEIIVGGTVSLAPSDGLDEVSNTTTIIRNGATVDGLTFGNVVLETAIDLTNVTIKGSLTIALGSDDVLNFSNVAVIGDILNDSAGNTLTLNSLNGSTLSTTEPGTANGLVNLVSSITLTVNGLIAGGAFGILDRASTTDPQNIGPFIIGEEPVADGTFSYVYDANKSGDKIIIQMIAVGFVEINQSVILPETSQTITIEPEIEVNL